MASLNISRVNQKLGYDGGIDADAGFVIQNCTPKNNEKRQNTTNIPLEKQIFIFLRSIWKTSHLTYFLHGQVWFSSWLVLFQADWRQEMQEMLISVDQ